MYLSSEKSMEFEVDDETTPQEDRERALKTWNVQRSNELTNSLLRYSSIFSSVYHTYVPSYVRTFAAAGFLAHFVVPAPCRT